MKRKPPEQPSISDDLPTREWLNELSKWVQAEKNKPINKAGQKLYAFVSGCVNDPDFQQSPALLHLLMVLRDELADGATEEWTLDDYLEPVVSKLKSSIARARNAGLKKQCQIEWLQQKKDKPALKKFNFACDFKSKHPKAPSAKRIADAWLKPSELKK